ncbi:MAG TPA: tetratricopeptide repeat protein [Candidatus Methanoperedens sp.]|nr:tetratricopeptide repeat protein [Candidatus Methanoperedens sp.]
MSAGAGTKRRPRAPLLAAALALAVLALYAPALTHDFVDFDDDLMVTENPHVLAGLTRQGIAWSLTALESFNWLPLTWWSHMLDVSLFGLEPGGHHAVSVALHALNAALLFLLLRSLAGAAGAPLIAAAIFALHPLRVESVAWVAERKDVLSAAFWLLAMLAYVRWCRRPTIARYGETLLVFALGLMAKPMLVTLPFALLLLDVWPLGRTRGAGHATWGRLISEKVPFFVLSGVVSLVTIVAQGTGGGVVTLADVPPLRRLANAVFAYGWYLARTVWPADLMLPYLRPAEGWPGWQVAVSAAVLAGATAACVLLWHRRPSLLSGWLWYLGTLVPVIGFVQVGPQGMADRYSYVPLIGPAVSAGWAAAAIARAWPAGAPAAALLGLAVAGALGAGTRAQLQHWRDSETLFARALAIDPGNPLAHNNLGLHLAYHQRWQEAEGHYRQALRTWPGYAQARYNLGVALQMQRQSAAAAAEFEAAAATLAAPAEAALAEVRLTRLLSALGREGEIPAHLERAVALDPTNDTAAYDLGTLYLIAGRSNAAATLLAGVVGRSPGNAEARTNLGYALLRLGRHAAAVGEFAAAARLRPDDPRARVELGLALREAGREEEARVEFQAALRLSPGYRPALEALAGG